MTIISSLFSLFVLISAWAGAQAVKVPHITEQLSTNSKKLDSIVNKLQDIDTISTVNNRLMNSMNKKVDSTTNRLDRLEERVYTSYTAR